MNNNGLSAVFGMDGKLSTDFALGIFTGKG
jgi:hypothetical protein